MKLARIEKIETVVLEEPVEVYDIEVEDNHNFFISSPSGGPSVLAHNCGATEFSRVVNNINVRHKFGLTGTLERKDGKHFLIKEIIGPITAETDAEVLTPTWEFVDTGVGGREYRSWHHFNMFLATHKKRNKMIVKEALKYALDQGRGVVIPVAYVKHANELVKAINKKAGRTIAIAFTAKNLDKKSRRKAILAARRNKKIKIVVGIRKLVQVGLNVPIWSVLLHVAPISNRPKYKQETGRICTPIPGKPQPVVRVFCDDMNIARGCIRGMFWQVAVPQKFKISSEDREKFKAYVAGKKPNTVRIGKRF